MAQPAGTYYTLNGVLYRTDIPQEQSDDVRRATASALNLLQVHPLANPDRWTKIEEPRDNRLFGYKQQQSTNNKNLPVSSFILAETLRNRLLLYDISLLSSPRFHVPRFGGSGRAFHSSGSSCKGIGDGCNSSGGGGGGIGEAVALIVAIIAASVSVFISLYFTGEQALKAEEYRKSLSEVKAARRETENPKAKEVYSQMEGIIKSEWKNRSVSAISCGVLSAGLILLIAAASLALQAHYANLPFSTLTTHLTVAGGLTSGSALLAHAIRPIYRNFSSCSRRDACQALFDRVQQLQEYAPHPYQYLSEQQESQAYVEMHQGRDTYYFVRDDREPNNCYYTTHRQPSYSNITPEPSAPHEDE